MTFTNRVAVITGLTGLAWCAMGLTADWVTAPTYFYAHDQSGQRVQQYPEWGPQYLPWRSGFGGGFKGFPGAGLPGAGYSGHGLQGEQGFGRPFNGYGYGGRVEVPYPGYRLWFDDRHPALDDRAPFRHQPFRRPFGSDRLRPPPNPDP